MNKRALACLSALAAALALLSVFAFDRHLALAVYGSAIENSVFFVDGRKLLDDLASGHALLGSHPNLSGLLLGSVLLVIGILWWLARRNNFGARALIFTGSVQLVTIICAWLIKNVFGRMRPFEAIAGDWQHLWFAGGNSFPSGHVAYFWGLFLPLAYLFPKYRIALLIVPVYIGFDRIDENAHFLSDVLAAITLAALITLFAAVLGGRWLRTAGRRQP